MGIRRRARHEHLPGVAGAQQIYDHPCHTGRQDHSEINFVQGKTTGAIGHDSPVARHGQHGAAGVCVPGNSRDNTLGQTLNAFIHVYETAEERAHLFPIVAEYFAQLETGRKELRRATREHQCPCGPVIGDLFE